MRLLFLLCLLCSCGALLYAQTDCPDIIRRGDTLFAPEAKFHQWLKDGAEIPYATKRYYLPTEPGKYTVWMRSMGAEPLDYTPGPTVTVAGAVLDERLRPIPGAEVTVGGAKAKTNASGRFYITAQRAERLAAQAHITGYHAHTVGFMPTAADTQFVSIHLAKKVVTHKVSAAMGGKISHDGFWLTLPPNGVTTADGRRYSGEIHLSVVSRRPGDRDFAQRMPGGDFMAEDQKGAAKVLYSYGFTGVEMATPDGRPLQLAQPATIEFLITEDQRPGAPDAMPLWHFDETQGLWVEEGVIRKEGLTYRAEVPHFSWWNCDIPYPPAYIDGNIVNCWGAPVLGGKVVVGQRTALTDNNGGFKGAVPATIDLDVTIVNDDMRIKALNEEESRSLGTFDGGWGMLEAVGLVDTGRILNVFAYGALSNVEYSLDNENWQTEPTFVLPNDAVPAHGWARLEGCDTVRFNNFRPPLFDNCVVYTYSQLENGVLNGSIPAADSMEALLSATETMYGINLKGKDLNLLANVATRQRCVQMLNSQSAINTPAESYDAIQKLCGLWPNLRRLSLQSSGMNDLPPAIGGLAELEVLHVISNQLARAPDAVSYLIRLKELSMDYNQLTSLPDSICNLKLLIELSVNGNRLASLPDSIGRLKTLVNLYLNGNRLTSLPDSIGQLKALKNLNLSVNQLASLPDSIGQLKALEDLDLGANQLTSLPDSIGQLKALKEMNLSMNQLASLPPSMGNLSSLTQLSLSSNPLKNVPDFIGNLSRLTTLGLASDQLSDLPAAMGELKALTNLNLSSNLFATAPDVLGQLTNLNILDLSGNQLTALPDAMSTLTALTNLNLRGNRLTSLPDYMGSFANLNFLTLSGNQLAEVPATLGNLKKLSNLDLSGNPLTSLPDELRNLSSLTSLNLCNTGLTNLPDYIGTLKTLVTLNICSLELQEAPDWLGNLKSLGQLDLSQNELTSLPGTLDRLKSLNTLNISNNRLTSVPDYIGSLTNLTQLELGNNQLTSIPDTLSNLARLGKLGLSYNNLTTVPDALAKLRDHLWTLDLRGNSISPTERDRIRLMLPKTQVLY